MQQMSLSSAENILSIHGGDVEAQLCTRNPLIIVATILASSVQLKDVSLNEDIYIYIYSIYSFIFHCNFYMIHVTTLHANHFTVLLNDTAGTENIHTS